MESQTTEALEAPAQISVTPLVSTTAVIHAEEQEPCYHSTAIKYAAILVPVEMMISTDCFGGQF